MSFTALMIQREVEQAARKGEFLQVDYMPEGEPVATKPIQPAGVICAEEQSSFEQSRDRQSSVPTTTRGPRQFSLRLKFRVQAMTELFEDRLMNDPITIQTERDGVVTLNLTGAQYQHPPRHSSDGTEALYLLTTT